MRSQGFPVFSAVGLAAVLCLLPGCPLGTGETARSLVEGRFAEDLRALADGLVAIDARIAVLETAEDTTGLDAAGRRELKFLRVAAAEGDRLEDLDAVTVKQAASAAAGLTRALGKSRTGDTPSLRTIEGIVGGYFVFAGEAFAVVDAADPPPAVLTLRRRAAAALAETQDFVFGDPQPFRAGVAAAKGFRLVATACERAVGP